MDFKMPRPLPIPPTFTGNGRDYRQYVWSRDTSTSSQDGSLHGSPTVEDLPSNPKLWTSAQVSTYLYTALRAMALDLEGEALLPISAVEDIVAFTREANINGRIFLRLIAEDLDKCVYRSSGRNMCVYIDVRRGVCPAWRDTLLTASRNLRQNVIKGRIWGRESEYSESPSPSLPSYPFTNPSFNSSSSSLDLTDEDSEKSKRPQHRHGRVRGMVATFERSGSFSSEGSFDGEGPQGREELGRWFKSATTPEDQMVTSPLVTEPLPLASPSPIRPPTDEPTVETLLAESERMGSWGARAWEEFDIAPGVTIKRVDVSPSLVPETPTDLTTHTVIACNGRRLGEGISSRHKAKQDRRVVTAIFTPVASDRSDENVDSPIVDIDGPNSTTRVSFIPSEIKDDRPQSSDSTRELTLQAELAETRALVDVFRARLEDVERKVAELEQIARRSDSKDVERVQLMSPEADPIPGHRNSVEADPDETCVEDALTSAMSDAGDIAKAVSPDLLDISAPIQTLNLCSDERPNTSDVGAEDTAEPSLVSELPQYVLLVGLGVCAVVFRVLMKKTVGRGSGFGWRL